MNKTVFNCCNNESNASPAHEFKLFLESPYEKQQFHKEIIINNQPYHEDLINEELDIIVRIVRKQWSHLQSVALYDLIVPHSSLATIREEINRSLRLTANCLKSCDSPELKARYLNSVAKAVKYLSPLILSLTEVEEEIVGKLSKSVLNNEKCPVYLYFHTFLDIQYYLLMLSQLCGNTTEVEDRLKKIMTDFTLLSRRNYEHKSKSAFVCKCNENFWMVIQLLMEDGFWTPFNKTLEVHDKQFCLWLLKDIAMLQTISNEGKYIGCLSNRIKPNYSFLESTLKSLLVKTDLNHSTLLQILQSIEPLVCNLWLKDGKVEIYQNLWEYFSKKLNTSLRVNVNFTLEELVELIDTILWTPGECKDDFELFLGMLSMHLNEHPYHWGKMKGRIYSQLGPNKIKDLTEIGIFHILLLFVTLTRVNFEELSKKFMSFVENLPVERRQSQLVWNFYSSLIVRYVRENRNIEPIAPQIIKILEEASNDQKCFKLIKSFVNNFEVIIRVSSNLQLNQSLLINTWIHKYMSACYHPDLIILLNILLKTIERVNSEQVWSDWEDAFKSYVYPTLKYVCSSLSAPEISGTLAGKITVSSSSMLGEAFIFFCSDSIVAKVSASFLCVVLGEYPNSIILSSHQERIALQCWVKVCLLTTENYEELTKNIVKLDILPGFLKSVLVTSQDPLNSFIDCLSDGLSQHLQSVSIHKLVETCFGPAEKWLNQHFTSPDNENVILRIYTCVASAFSKIGPLLYNRYKTNCPYIRLVSTMLLPSEVMMGKTINPNILQAIKKTWHPFFEATLNLNGPNDTFIDRTLRELVVKYIPYFTIVDSPMIKCLDNDKLADVILDKMSNAFFKQPSKEAESSIFKALRLINDFVTSTTSSTVFRLVITKTLFGLFEVVMFHSQRNTALSIVKLITASPLYGPVKGDFEDVLVAITEKHLAFNTSNYFQLLNILVKFIPADLKNLMPKVKQQVCNVERMRGVGFDKTLRLHLERLDANLLQSS